MQMFDPLGRFDWSSLYGRYDAQCRGHNPASIHLQAMQPPAATDRLLYYHLVRASHQDSGGRPSLDLGQYEALLYWKLNSNHQALGNLRSWLRKDEDRRHRNDDQLQQLLAGIPSAIPQEVSAVTELLDRIDDYPVDGMKSATALPVRSTFLHILYPSVVPIFDKMVLQAVGITDEQANQNLDVFRAYLPHAWHLAQDHAAKLVGFEETPVRLIDMALWVIRNAGSQTPKA
jgi:hypothetical protein